MVIPNDDELCQVGRTPVYYETSDPYDE